MEVIPLVSSISKMSHLHHCAKKENARYSNCYNGRFKVDFHDPIRGLAKERIDIGEQVICRTFFVFVVSSQKSVNVVHVVGEQVF